MSEPNYAKLEANNPHLDKDKPYPLAGILVVDFTHVLSGPTCTRMLADAGARVIHIERKTGDDTRHMGPYIADGSSEYFRICNAGKESIALDLKDPKDHALAEKMIAKADVVVENFRPGVMARLGFVDSWWGVILPQLADAIGIFMLTQSMRNIPKVLLDSLQVDNISVWHTMKDVIVPITKPALTSTSIWFFILSWNEYIWPNLMLKSEANYTLPLALQLFVSSEGGTNFTVAMALSVLTMAIPLIVYLLFQRMIIDTFTASGIK
ncbi:CoA transferase [Staphylococcus nepalensis]|uniref:CoA transferase n=1 Tax=Staphylococcus nepalensis TaxID=214473 RepID=UPI0024BB2613|nr:CoA transferase [Staphylococcus nepalensis]